MAAREHVHRAGAARQGVDGDAPALPYKGRDEVDYFEDIPNTLSASPCGDPRPHQRSCYEAAEGLLSPPVNLSFLPWLMVQHSRKLGGQEI